VGTSVVPGRELADPKEAVPEHEEERERSEWWKAKKMGIWYFRQAIP